MIEIQSQIWRAIFGVRIPSSYFSNLQPMETKITSWEKELSTSFC